MLALLLLFPNVAGKETQNDVLTTQHIAFCPDTGYYFKRDVTPNAIDPGPCNLCFCQDNITSVCWLRESKRCDPKGYTFSNQKKRADRSRRSPGLSDIFFRDAAREVFDRQTPQQCKPFESSISEGCPPADWCIGCTVCDCDANGRWDCHTLSFCPDKKGKKQVRKKKYHQSNRIVKRQLPKKKSTPKTTKRPNKKPTKKIYKKAIIGKKPQKKNYNFKQNKKQVNKKGNLKKIPAVIKSKGPIHKNKAPPKLKGSNKNVKKGKTPIKINSNKGQIKKGQSLDQHEAFLYTKNILKKVMASVDKIVNDNTMKVKQAISKQFNEKNKKSRSKKVKKIQNWQPVKNENFNRKQRSSRRKRQISKDSEYNFEKDNTSKIHTKLDNIVFPPSRKYNNETLKSERSISSNKHEYFEYNVDSKYDNSTKEKNKSEELYTKTLILLKSNDLKNAHVNNVTVTEITIMESVYNGTTTSPLLIDISNIVKKSLFKMSLNNTSYKKNKNCGKFCQLIKKIKMLIGDVGRRIVTKKKDNAKTKNLTLNLRNVFRRLFQPSKKKNASVIKNPVYRKRNIIKKLCTNIKPCNFDSLDRTLQSKLDLLGKESNIILKSVRIIKGLLKLLDGKEFSVQNNTSSIDKNQKNKVILILDAILKDGPNLASTFTNLTKTQLKQIDYIRDNTKTFIQSIENFALILDDIMKLLRKDNKQRISLRTLRCTRMYKHESVKNSTVSEKIQKLKSLLINYNLVQNKFMKGMFDVLVTLDQKTKPDIRTLAKVSDENAKYNESLVIDNYTKKIINNLRKLKNLAEKLSFKNRMKRGAMGDDDTLDYFLLLIEYLLKQNRPLDVPPVSDGIDILIEAIQNSPDLKSNQKIDLGSVPLEIIKTDIITPKSPLAPPNHSKKKTNENNINKIVKVFESLDEESTRTNMYDFTDTYDKKNGNFENENKLFSEKSTINDLDLTTFTPNVYIANDDDENVNRILDRFDNEKNYNKKGYEVFVDETDEDDAIIDTSTKSSVESADSVADIPVTQNTPKRTTFPLGANKNTLKNSLNTLQALKNTNLKWVEENLSHEENRKGVLDIKETTTKITIQTATRTLKKASSRYSNPDSSISREVEDERQGKTMNPEYLMHKKQMNLLNSLDYETEKSRIDSDSKEEKYVSNSFTFM